MKILIQFELREEDELPRGKRKFDGVEHHINDQPTIGPDRNQKLSAPLRQLGLSNLFVRLLRIARRRGLFVGVRLWHEFLPWAPHAKDACSVAQQGCVRRIDAES